MHKKYIVLIVMVLAGQILAIIIYYLFKEKSFEDLLIVSLIAYIFGYKLKESKIE